MGNAKFYYTPDAFGSLEVVDLGEGVSDLQESMVRRVSEAETLQMRRFGNDYGARLQIRIVLERFVSTSLERDLQAMIAHLQRGRSVAFAADSAKAWMGYATSPYVRGATVLRTYGNPLGQFEDPVGTVAAGDEVRITSSNPERIDEISTVSTLTGNTLTLASGLRYAYTAEPILIRHRDFYPVLRLAPEHYESPPLTHEHRISYTLDLALWEDPEAVDLLANLGSGQVTGTGEASFSKRKSVDQVVEQEREKKEKSVGIGKFKPQSKSF